MADLNTRERLQPSLLDRLTDLAPDSKRETFEQQTLGWQQLRQAVLRDLAWLLNTTNLAALEDLDTAPLAAASTVNYGIPGFAGLVGTTDRMATLEAGIAAVAEDPRCTIEDQSLFSHRRGAPTGRLASVIWIDPS